MSVFIQHIGPRKQYLTSVSDTSEIAKLLQHFEGNETVFITHYVNHIHLLLCLFVVLAVFWKIIFGSDCVNSWLLLSFSMRAKYYTLPQNVQI